MINMLIIDFWGLLVYAIDCVVPRTASQIFTCVLDLHLKLVWSSCDCVIHLKQTDCLLVVPTVLLTQIAYLWCPQFYLLIVPTVRMVHSVMAFVLHAVVC